MPAKKPVNDPGSRLRRDRWRRRLVRWLNLTVGAFVGIALTTLALSTGHPPTLSSEVRAVQRLPASGVLVYGTIHGSFGPLRRGFGQAIGRASLDLVTDDGRFITLAHRIEESAWPGMLWPPNWLREDVWFAEVLPPLTGFESVRVRLTDRLGNDRVSAPYSLSGGPGKPSIVPSDVRTLALPGLLFASAAEPIVADDSTLKAPRR